MAKAAVVEVVSKERVTEAMTAMSNTEKVMITELVERIRELEADGRLSILYGDVSDEADHRHAALAFFGLADISGEYLLQVLNTTLNRSMSEGDEEIVKSIEENIEDLNEGDTLADLLGVAVCGYHHVAIAFLLVGSLVEHPVEINRKRRVCSAHQFYGRQ